MNIIREDFFHFLWQNLHFTPDNLVTTHGGELQVLHPGYPNEGDGPDYRFARIRMSGIIFYGDVELHKKSSEWYEHRHDHDSRYERVILHVVVHDDLHRRMVHASDGNAIPTLELRQSLPPRLNRLWAAWHRPVELPCSGLLEMIPPAMLSDIAGEWDEKFFRHRTDRLMQLYPDGKSMQEAWTTMLVRSLFEGLGYENNKSSMLVMAESALQYVEESRFGFPVPIRQNTGTTDGALPDQYRRLSHFLLRQAGLLPAASSVLKRSNWDFSGSRPANHPDNRIRQAAELYLKIRQIPAISWLKGPLRSKWKEIAELTQAHAIGNNRHNVLYHNVIVPAVWLLGSWLHDRETCRQAREQWMLQRIPLPRKVDTLWRQSKMPAGDHYHRLALLHQYKYYCKNKRCSECAIMKFLARA